MRHCYLVFLTQIRSPIHCSPLFPVRPLISLCAL